MAIRKNVCVLATQVQARTQQLTATKGQRDYLLVGTHVKESSSLPIVKATSVLFNVGLVTRAGNRRSRRGVEIYIWT